MVFIQSRTWCDLKIWTAKPREISLTIVSQSLLCTKYGVLVGAPMQHRTKRELKKNIFLCHTNFNTCQFVSYLVFSSFSFLSNRKMFATATLCP